MATNRNSTDQTDTDDLRRSFMLALSDSLKTGEKVAAGTLEVVRKYLADVDADRRWTVEQQALVAAPGVAPGATGEAATSTPPRIVHGIDLDRLPFRTKSKGFEVPPKAPEADDSEKPVTTWDALNAQPFLSPE